MERQKRTLLHGLPAAFASLALLATYTGHANNIQVSNATLTGDNGTAVMVQFDLSWENSWRGGGLSNWDAAWVFVKYRDNDNVWHHVNLGYTGHMLPVGSGAALSTGEVDPNAAYNATTNPTVGVFIHRGIPGSGTFTLTGVQLKWNYVEQGVSYADIDDIGVFGIEMVYVPQGAFLAGTTSTGGDVPPPFTLSTINTANVSIVASGTGGILGTPQGGVPSGESTPNLLWPNGYEAFYCMKYEVSEQAFADFMNTLTYMQQLSHGFGPAALYGTGTPGSSIWTQTPSGGMSPNIMALNGDGDANFNEPEDGADLGCAGLNWGDLFAYLDWSGLRIMTEMEYEKVCRGTIPAVTPTEYAWGTAAVNTLPYTVTALGTANEGISANYSTTAGNANYYTTSGINRAYRVGCFAANAANTGRQSAGASFYGAMEMSGNLRECVVKKWGDGSGYTAFHGNGEVGPYGLPNVSGWPGVGSSDGNGAGYRGGGFLDIAARLRITDRVQTQLPEHLDRVPQQGGRGVRSAP